MVPIIREGSLVGLGEVRSRQQSLRKIDVSERYSGPDFLSS
jgi:hypothetical protein